jgi:membrane dipeptidase
MASHTGVYDVFPHIRNLPSDVLKGIVELGGVVGIYTLTFGLGVSACNWGYSNSGYDPFLAHLTEAVKICGVDAVGVGTDGAYREIDEEELRQNFDQLKKLLDPDGLLQARFPDHSLELYSPQKLEKLAPVVQEATWIWDKQAGEKIMGNNFARFLREALPKG